MDQSVVCYLKRDGQYLLLYRNKKENDYNKGKWIGVGGHIEKNETPDQAAIREVKEETGYDVHTLHCFGEVLFVSDDYREMMYVYEIDDFDGDEIACDEGELKWIPIGGIYNYPMWEGDKEFLPLLINHAPFFRMKLIYKNNVLMDVIKY